MTGSVRPSARFPWVTAVLAALAVLFAFAPASVRDALLYSRPGIASGQLWRLWTGHWIHFGASHAIWDLAVFLVIGCLLERRAPRLHAALLATAPAFISAVLFAAAPQLVRYGGLSGVNMALAAALGLVGTRSAPRWPWLLLLGVLTAKMVSDQFGYTFSPIRFASADILTVPLAHTTGALFGATLAAVWRPARHTAQS